VVDVRRLRLADQRDPADAAGPADPHDLRDGWLAARGIERPEAFEHGTVWIAVGMLVVVLVHGLMYLQAARTFGSIFVANLAAVAVVFFAQLVSDGWPRYALWAVAVGIVWMVPVVHNQKGFNLHPAHIVEATAWSPSWRWVSRWWRSAWARATSRSMSTCCLLPFSASWSQPACGGRCSSTNCRGSRRC
jgi:hypothetical protein